MGRFIDLTGQKFGKLTVVKRGYDKRDRMGRPIVTWECQCDCGNTINVSSQKLRTGHTKSCGCLRHTNPKNYINHNFDDLTGKRFGRLTVIYREENSKSGNSMWKCKCDCGNETVVPACRLRSGKTKSCGCFRKEFHQVKGSSKKKTLQKNKKTILETKYKPYKDISGQRFGRLTVIRYLDITERKKKNKNWLCRCDCGEYTTANASILKCGTKKSCGCLAIENSRRPRKHGMSKTRIWNIYQGMVKRCNNKEEPAYKDYGGRGITICDEWTGNEGMEKFFDWAFKNGYKDDLEIDRIDVNGNYEPSNCRWATPSQQSRNKRNNIRIEYNGRIQTLPDWCDELGLEYNMIYLRYKRGWSTDRMFTQPKRII